MYLGSHAINLDAKGRLAIPAKVRDQLVADCGGHLVVTAHPQERCLLIYPEPHWARLVPQIKSLPNMSKSTRLLQRLLLGYAQTMELDANGRVLLSPTLRDYARMEKSLMLVGQGDKLEIWSEEAWHSWIDEAGNEDQFSDEVRALNI